MNFHDPNVHQNAATLAREAAFATPLPTKSPVQGPTPSSPTTAEAAKADADVAIVTSSSSMGNTTKSGHSFVLVVVGLLGAAMIAMKVVLQRHRRVFLRRHQYNEVNATHIDV